MSDYGMQVFNEYGQLRLNIYDRTFRLVTQFIAPAGSSGSVNVSGISTKSPIACAAVYNISEYGLVINFPHAVSISGDSVSYYPSIGGAGPSIIWVYASS